MRTGLWLFPSAPAPTLVEAVAAAEAAGLAEFWLGDEGPAREPFAVLAAAAVRTERIRLAVGVTNPYVRHPGVAATAMCTIDELGGGGRAVLGIGAGGSLSLDPFGLRADAPVARVREALETIDAVRRGVSGGSYTPPLEHTVTALGLEVYVGARGERLNRLASDHAHGAFLSGLPLFRYDEVIGWCRSVRPIDIALYPTAVLDEASLERLRPQMVWGLLDTPAATTAELGLDGAHLRRAADALRSGRARPATDLITDDVLAQLVLWGSATEVGARLAALAAHHQPCAIGLSLVATDPTAAVDFAAAATLDLRRP